MAGFLDLKEQREGVSSISPKDDSRAIVWFDIDNCLYPKSSKIHDLMVEKIHAYFLSLGLPVEKARDLHKKYYKDYGLAIRGLVRHHDIDALQYDEACDASLPLEDILSVNPALQKLLGDLDRSKVRVFCITNAYKTHAVRVLKLLGIDHLIEGLCYCDYARPDGDFACKPEKSFFEDAIRTVSGTPTENYFVDDSLLNVKSSIALGWKGVWFSEPGGLSTDAGPGGFKALQEPGGTELLQEKHEVKVKDGAPLVEALEELRDIWPEVFTNSGH